MRYATLTIAAVAAATLTATPALAAPFASDFTGTPNWNWDGATTGGNATVTGTDQLVVDSGGDGFQTLDAGYVTEALSIPATEGTIVTSFTLLDIANGDGSQQEIKLFEIGTTSGNKSQTSSGMISEFGLRYNGGDDRVRFDATSSIRFNESGTGTGLNTLSGGPLDVTITTKITNTGDDWTVETTADIVDGLDTYSTGTATYTRTQADYQGFQEAGAEYRLGVLGSNTFSGNQSGVGNIVIDDFSATFTPIPEPASAGMILGGLGLLMGRRRRA